MAWRHWRSKNGLVRICIIVLYVFYLNAVHQITVSKNYISNNFNKPLRVGACLPTMYLVKPFLGRKNNLVISLVLISTTKSSSGSPTLARLSCDRSCAKTTIKLGYWFEVNRHGQHFISQRRVDTCTCHTA